jgi:hypothetical protein
MIYRQISETPRRRVSGVRTTKSVLAPQLLTDFPQTYPAQTHTFPRIMDSPRDLFSQSMAVLQARRPKQQIRQTAARSGSSFERETGIPSSIDWIRPLEDENF